MSQTLAEGRQIIFPGKNARTQRKLRIGPPDNVFKKRAHAGHHFEIADNGLPDAFADGVGFRNKSFHDLEELRFEIGVIDGKKEMLMPALAHEIADAFVHGHARGRSEEHTSELQSQSNLVCRLL